MEWYCLAPPVRTVALQYLSVLLKALGKGKGLVLNPPGEKGSSSLLPVGVTGSQCQTVFWSGGTAKSKAAVWILLPCSACSTAPLVRFAWRRLWK